MLGLLEADEAREALRDGSEQRARRDDLDGLGGAVALAAQPTKARRAEARAITHDHEREARPRRGGDLVRVRVRARVRVRVRARARARIRVKVRLRALLMPSDGATKSGLMVCPSNLD